MATNTKIKIRLQGHEKFALRDGWLTKGLSIIDKRPDAFLGSEGPDLFGIGNNMVKSLRYWMKAFKLIEENSGIGAKLSELGKIILQNDVYLEKNFTLWILHSQITKNIADATTWYMFFNKCNVIDMEKDEIEKILYREISQYVMGQPFSENSLKNDVDVLLNMYSKNKVNSDPEDKSQSPFANLGLVKNTENLYSQTSPKRRDIDEWVVLYELAEMMRDKNEISIERVLNGTCGISHIYQVKPVLANELLDRLDAAEYIRVDRTAGLDMIYRTKAFTTESVMADYYKR
jgi:hypothetical protein